MDKTHQLIAAQTTDAYSFPRYGKKHWLDCVRMLVTHGYDAVQVECILRSKITRYAADRHEGRGKATAGDLLQFVEGERNQEYIAELFTEQLGPFEVHKHSVLSNGSVSRTVEHSHPAGNFPYGHRHPGMGPATFTRYSDDWYRASRGLGGRRIKPVRKTFTPAPSGEQFPYEERTDRIFELHVGKETDGFRGLIDPRDAARGAIQLIGASGWSAARMMLTFGDYCKVMD